MRRRDWLKALIAGTSGGVLLGGCAGLDGAPSTAARSALAPTGRLRVAFLDAPLYVTRNASSGELTGVAVDLGRELAGSLGVPFEPVVHRGAAALLAGARAGEWDVALTGITAERAATMDFSAPYLQVEWGALVPAGAQGMDVSALDRPGLRVGIVERTFADAAWAARLSHAKPVRVGSVAELLATLDGGRADVVVATKATMFAAARDRPGSRVLDGQLLVEPIGMAVPKGRDVAAARYVAAFVERAKAQGLVASAVERAGLRGVVVPRA